MFAIAAAVFVHLWILEGALRKWVPGTESLMYFARDIVIILVLMLLGLFCAKAEKPKPFIAFWLILAVLTLLAVVQVIALPIDLRVAIVGLRSYLAPLFLLYGALRYGFPGLSTRLARIIVAYGPVLALLAIVQVLSPATSVINRQVGSDEAYFINFGVVRASGTFSAPAGLSTFAPLCLALSLALMSQPARSKDFKIGVVGLLSSLAIVGLGGNRLAVLGALIVAAIYCLRQLSLGSSRETRRLAGFLLIITLVAVVAVAAFPSVLNAFSQRFENASQSEDSSARLVEQTFGFLTYPMSFFGHGIGVHSQAGISLGSGREWVEWDTEKWVAELGIIGWFLAVLRLALSTVLIGRVMIAIHRLPLLASMSFAAVIPTLLYGQITQFPSNQAFVSIAMSILVLSWPNHSAHVRAQKSAHV